MADTYTQLYVHYVIAVKGRENNIALAWEDRLYNYIIAIINNKGQRLIAINGIADHIHILAGIKPTMLIADLAREIKANSSKFINENKFVKGKFYWQEGYGAFTVSHSHVGVLSNYIANQKEHHKKNSFKDEYLSLLKKYDIEYNEAYIFTWE